MEQLEKGGGAADTSMADTLAMQNLGTMRVAKIKNYTPAEIQITAEQLLRESQAYRMDGDGYKAPKHRIQDENELEDYKYRQRRDFEEVIRR
jgi:crooked neck